MSFLIWDFDGTLAVRSGGWSGTLCEVAASDYPRLEVRPDLVRQHLGSGFPWHAPEVVRVPGSPEEWWESLTPVFRRALGSMLDIADTDARRLALKVRDGYLRGDRWQLFDDVASTLVALQAMGWKHLVLSNHVPELELLVEGLGLSPLIERVYSSGCTGKEKPNPAAFECVFADFPDARRGWMIGDSWSVDVQGATAVGMRSILVRSDHPSAVHRCEALHGVIGIVDRDR